MDLNKLKRYIYLDFFFLSYTVVIIIIIFFLLLLYKTLFDFCILILFKT